MYSCETFVKMNRILLILLLVIGEFTYMWSSVVFVEVSLCQVFKVNVCYYKCQMRECTQRTLGEIIRAYDNLLGNASDLLSVHLLMLLLLLCKKNRVHSVYKKRIDTYTAMYI